MYGHARIANAFPTLLATACSHRTQRVERERVCPPSAQPHRLESNQRS